MKPNIFLMNPGLGDEDALTYYWYYVLSVVPGLGQAFVDEVCRLSGLVPSKFVEAIDHPPGNQENRPDLLIRCADYNLLFEHKLDSPVGERQLQRYLELAKERDWKLALLAGNRIAIDEGVLAAPTFVRPQGIERPQHFLWQDLHPILTSVDHHLAREFGELLECIGLGRFSWAGLGNPFVDQGAGNALLDLYESIRPVVDGPGVQCRRSANSLIYQVRTPFHPVHLINIGPRQSVALDHPTLRGPVMDLWVWVRRHGDPQRRVLPMADGSLDHASAPIVVHDHHDPVTLSYDKEVCCERSYYVPLEYILQESHERSEEHLVTFVRSAVGHLRRDVAALRDGA